MLRKLAISLLLSLVTTVSFAFDGYQIELIIFSNINTNNFNSEHWPLLKENSINLTTAVVPPKVPNQNFQMSSSSQFILTDELNRLVKYSPYKIILHMAWRESYIKLNKLTTVHLYGGQLYNDKGQVINAVINESLPYSPNQHWQLNGKVSLQLQRYFDMKFNLLFALPNQQVATENAGPFTYIHIVENRRLKSRELNYIDHPLYGVLFKIVPVNESLAQN